MHLEHTLKDLCKGLLLLGPPLADLRAIRSDASRPLHMDILFLLAFELYDVRQALSLVFVDQVLRAQEQSTLIEYGICASILIIAPLARVVT